MICDDQKTCLQEFLMFAEDLYVPLTPLVLYPLVFVRTKFVLVTIVIKTRNRSDSVFYSHSSDLSVWAENKQLTDMTCKTLEPVNCSQSTMLT